MDRRRFLQWGAAGVVGSIVLGACTNDGGGGASPGQPTSTTSIPNTTGTGPTDLTLTRTAASLEAMLIGLHQQLARSTLLSPTVIGLTNTFLDHHTQHLAALNGVITNAGGPAITDPNAVLEKTIVQPALTAAQSQDELVHLVYTLEDATAQTYAYAAAAMTRPDLRATAMTIAGIETRHRTLVGVQLEQQALDDLFPAAFARRENPLPPDALLT